ncbi:hypothetical protein SAMN06265795_107119 [Noviherbaspirillum humi]|uniref:Uncharacterized protein n=1 Tax=Noviherbaspirillum humi TaxID=1688639 RepID=A0A239HRF0_9BURK|nr:hypothetical protein [Noviherbaspirillum humi]SNS83658.1 hypothetical protein SAMN06265795_107119 [Noviherbaspirillum humi]
MKTSTTSLRLAAAAALISSLAACGGYSGVDLGGTVSGLTTNGLVLANGGSTVSVPANATSYKFPNQIGNQSAYSVTIQSQPARLTCGLVNASGTSSGVPVDYVNVTCTANTYTLGGSVNGLTGSGLVLANGTDTVSVAAGSTSFVFPTAVADGTSYGVAVLTQPAGQTCSVTNGTAVMGAGNVTNVVVNCL